MTKTLANDVLILQASAEGNNFAFDQHLGKQIVGWHFSGEKKRPLIDRASREAITGHYSIMFAVNTGIDNFLPNELYVGELDQVIFEHQPQFKENLAQAPSYYSKEFRDSVNVLFKVKDLRLVSELEYEEYCYALESNPTVKFDFTNFFHTKSNIAKLVKLKK